MPTAANRDKRIQQNRALIIFNVAIIVLMLLGFARIYTNTQNLEKQQHNACELRRAGRTNTNIHDRLPLRAALLYIGSLGAAGEKTGLTAKQRAASRSFMLRFDAYARSITALPNPQC